MRLRTALLLRSGDEDEYSDNAIEMTPDLQNELGAEGIPRLHINGYVWASLLRRALARLQDGELMAAIIGKYPKEDSKKTPEKKPQGVSPLWCEATFANFSKTEINPGNKIDRQYGATAATGLYNEEIVPQGHQAYLHFNYFYKNEDEIETIQNNLLAALWVVNEGIETIGGGWSYGFGRLEVCEVRQKTLNLEYADQRQSLWGFEILKHVEPEDWEKKKQELQSKKPKIVKPWIKYCVEAAIPAGQLLAIHTQTPPLDVSGYEKLPDTFVFTRTIIDEKGQPEQVPVITGKAFRQAILSSSIERKLRTIAKPEEKTVCLDTTKSKGCSCKRCLWFGATDRGGIISVGDAVVHSSAANVLNRIQLCEHTMQNMNLFSGEYLTQGQFNFEIIIDVSRKDANVDALIKELEWVLSEMKAAEECEERIAPPGWYRLGATTTCTGQIEIQDWNIKKFAGEGLS